MSWNKFREKKKDDPPLPPGYRGWPKTTIIENPDDPNLCGVVVRDACITPGGARFADMMMSAVGLILGADMVILGIEIKTLEFFIPAIAGVAGFAYLTKIFVRWLLACHVWIRIFGDRVEIAGWTGFDVYKANVGYTFRLDEHLWALYDDIKYRQNPENGRYYSDSCRLFLDHGHQPVEIAEVYPKDKANHLLGRLVDIQNRFNIRSFE